MSSAVWGQRSPQYPAPHAVSSHELDTLPLLACCQPLRPRPPPPPLSRGHGERAPGSLDPARPSQAVSGPGLAGHVRGCGLPSLLPRVPSFRLAAWDFSESSSLGLWPFSPETRGKQEDLGPRSPAGASRAESGRGGAGPVRPSFQRETGLGLSGKRPQSTRRTSRTLTVTRRRIPPSARPGQQQSDDASPPTAGFAGS